MGDILLIERFYGKYKFLSNFYEAPIRCNGYIYPSGEHLFQSLKAISPEDRTKIRKLRHPAEAKRVGRTIEIRKDWELVKVRKMGEVLKLKFCQNRRLKNRLLNTREAKLVEGNFWHDNFWGNCTCPKCSGKPGINKLGKLLMALRTDIRNGFYGRAI